MAYSFERVSHIKIIYASLQNMIPHLAIRMQTTSGLPLGNRQRDLSTYREKVMASESNSTSDANASQQKMGNDRSTPQSKMGPIGEAQHAGYCPPVQKPKETKAQYSLRLEKCRNHCLREFRIEIQEIVNIIDQHTAGQLNIVDHVEELQKSANDANNKIKEFSEVHLPAFDEPRDLDSEILHYWQLASCSPFLNAKNSQQNEQSSDSSDEQNRLRELNQLKSRLKRLIFLIGYSTVMERLNEWISLTHVGYALPFHRIFEDEIESADDRLRILQMISLVPKMIKGGLVDLTRGVVLCYPLSWWDRLIRNLIVFLLLVLSFTLVWGFSVILQSPDERALFGLTDGTAVTQPAILLKNWTALLLGIGAHILVAGAKLTNAEFRQFPMPLRDWSAYLSARTSTLIYKIVLALLVFIAMYLSLKGDMKLFDAFLIGYSFDSVVELLGASMEKSAGNKLTTFKDKLGVGGK